MKACLLFSCIALLGMRYSCTAQEYSYTRYDINDGLAGSTVYSITQDKDGFIWASTEAGVSRFDGVHFRNFTTNDGLPDVEILHLFGDSKDRVWMAPFDRSICYYYKGAIHNQQNDPLLRSIRVKGLIENFVEDESGTILVQEPSCLHLITAGGEVSEIDSVNGRRIDTCHGAAESRDGHFLVEVGDTVYHLEAGSFRPVSALGYRRTTIDQSYLFLGRDFVVYRSQPEMTCIRNLRNGGAKYLPFVFHHYRHVNYSILDDSLIIHNESDGSTAMNARSSGERHFLPGIEVSSVFRDDQQNLWFSTIGHGLYRLNSEEIRNFQLNGIRCHECGVYSITKTADKLLVGSSRNSIFAYQLPRLKFISATLLNQEEKRRIMGILPLGNGQLAIGTDCSLTIQSEDLHLNKYIRMVVKGVTLRPDGKLLVAGSGSSFLVNVEEGKRMNGWMTIDTIWRERTTAVYACGDTTYIGTLNGLYRLLPDGRSYYLGQDIPALRSRVAAITGDGKGMIWVAPYDDMGVIGIRNGKVVRRIGSAEGLTSNICRVIALHGDYLWVGTDKGLNRVDLAHPARPIIKYTSSDGLGSNVINTIFVDSQRVYVGTEDGFNYFDQSKGADLSTCRFVWLAVSANGRSRMEDTSDLRFSFRTNDIRFEFAGISYRSGGDISYRYRLTGLDTAWRVTQQNFLIYPVLPGGDYLLQVVAVDKWGNQSPVAGIHFAVSTPVWRQAWFIVALGLALVALAWLVMIRRIRRIRRRQEEERTLMRRINEMEHMALQAQMNPHFIFNCMNSIQQYIFDQDVFGANKYISGFSKLIRATLHNSNRPLIMLSEEIDYLSNYLSLERLRFKDKMEYRIEVDDSIDTSECMIPPMIIQPFAENSIRHGLRHKTSGKGVIVIRMEQSEDWLIVTIEDNGIGRREAALYKTREHIEYHSRGMSLTAERIKAMNSVYGRRIEFSVTDLEDAAGGPGGTRVRITFPLSLATMKSNANAENRFDP